MIRGRALVEVVGVGTIPTDDEQPVRGLLHQQEIAGNAGDALCHRFAIVQGDLQLLEEFPIAEPRQSLGAGDQCAVIDPLHEQGGIGGRRFSFSESGRRRDLGCTVCSTRGLACVKRNSRSCGDK